MTFRGVFKFWLLVLGLSLAVAACGNGGEATQDAGEEPDDTQAEEDDADDAQGDEEVDEEEEDGEQAAGESADPIPLQVNSLSFPSLVPVISEIIAAQGFDADHGLELTIQPFADIGPFYAALTTGQVDAGVGGPTVVQNLVSEGADVQIISTFATLEPLLVISADPEIQSLEDLRGRSLAATVASAEFQTLAVIARSQGLDLEEDVTLVNASPADVRTQLEAGRVDAGMLWEPGASLALQDGDDYEVILNGADAWEELTGEQGWELVWAMQRPFIEENPEAPEAWIAAQRDAVEWLFSNPEDAAQIMEEATGMPPDAFQTVLEQGRVDYEIQPAWEPDIRSSIERHFQEAVDNDLLESLPDDDIIFDPGS